MSAIIADHWTPGTDLAAAFPGCRKYALGSVVAGPQAVELPPDTIDMDSMEGEGMIMALRSVSPHVDEGPPFTALWVMRAVGQIVWVSATKPEDPRGCFLRRPARKQSFALAAGDLFFFNSHCIHWVDKGDDTMILLGKEFAETPTREQVELAFMKIAGTLEFAGNYSNRADSA